jgi:hypothetical protein
VTLSRKSSIAEVAGVVAEALERAGIKAVLSGGACASIHSQGVYQSVDVDFIIQSGASQPALDRILAREGFQRRGDQYFHEQARYYVEFPPGPVAIGGDFRITPEVIRVGAFRIRMLSATDSCRDRLAAAFHWDDEAARRTAVAIAIRNDLDFQTLRTWSESERSLEKYESFLREVDRAKESRRARRAPAARPHPKAKE